jgi:hypothetical protein
MKNMEINIYWLKMSSNRVRVVVFNAIYNNIFIAGRSRKNH